MKSIYKFAIAVLALPFVLMSCSDDDDYEPGPAPAENCMSVYFPTQFGKGVKCQAFAV